MDYAIHHQIEGSNIRESLVQCIGGKKYELLFKIFRDKKNFENIKDLELEQLYQLLFILSICQTKQRYTGVLG